MIGFIPPNLAGVINADAFPGDNLRAADGDAAIFKPQSSRFCSRFAVLNPVDFEMAGEERGAFQ